MHAHACQSKKYKCYNATDNLSHKSRTAVQIHQKKKKSDEKSLVNSVHRNVHYLGGEEGEEDAGSQLHDL